MFSIAKKSKLFRGITIGIVGIGICIYWNQNRKQNNRNRNQISAEELSEMVKNVDLKLFEFICIH